MIYDGRMSAPPWHRVGRFADLPPDEPVAVEIESEDGERLALALIRRGDEVFAVRDQCPHRGVPFSEMGLVDEEGHLICSWHYWSFDLADGRHTEEPSIRLSCYRVRVVDGAVEVDPGWSPVGVTEPR